MAEIRARISVPRRSCTIRKVGTDQGAGSSKRMPAAPQVAQTAANPRRRRPRQARRQRAKADRPAPARSIASSAHRQAAPASTKPDQSNRRRDAACTVGASRSASSSAATPERQIDQEDQPPVQMLGDEAAERRPEQRRGQPRPGQERDGAHQIRLVGRAQDHQPPDRHHHGAADPLQHAGGDEGVHRGRERAERGGER